MKLKLEREFLCEKLSKGLAVFLPRREWLHPCFKPSESGLRETNVERRNSCPLRSAEPQNWYETPWLQPSFQVAGGRIKSFSAITLSAQPIILLTTDKIIFTMGCWGYSKHRSTCLMHWINQRRKVIHEISTLNCLDFQAPPKTFAAFVGHNFQWEGSESIRQGKCSPGFLPPACIDQ